MADQDDRVHDVLVVGGGPSGSSCAYWLADAGWDVVVVEKKEFPREKTCGDGLAPRAVRQLADMGLEDSLAGAHRFRGLRSVAFGRTMELEWPTRAGLPDLRLHHHPPRPRRPGLPSVPPRPGRPCSRAPRPTSPSAKTSRRGRVAWRGARVRVVTNKKDKEPVEVRARYVVVADGANSRFGRALGTGRDRGYPQGMALRGYYRSERHDDPLIESHLDIRDANGDVVPGYGWVFPLGDGRVNVGVGLLSTDQRWKGVNTTRLMDAFVSQAPESGGSRPRLRAARPTGGRLPMGMAVGPRGRRQHDRRRRRRRRSSTRSTARASPTATRPDGWPRRSSPRRSRGGGAESIAAYERQLDAAYGDYYRVGRAFVRLISDPTAHARVRRPRDALRGRSWPSCCGSWPT